MDKKCSAALDKWACSTRYTMRKNDKILRIYFPKLKPDSFHQLQSLKYVSAQEETY